MSTAFVERIKKINQNIDRGLYKDEADSEGIVQRILQELGWDPHSPTSVKRQYDDLPDNSRVDFALLDSMGKPIVFIEVKRLYGINKEAIKQLFEYGAKKGVPLLILTDGRKWIFHYGLGSGDYSDRQFLELNIKEDSPERLEEQFRIFLSEESVDSGQAQEAARAEHEKQQQAQEEKRIERDLIAVLQDLLDNAHEGLRDLLRSKSRMLHSLRPDKMQKSMQRLSKRLSAQGPSSASQQSAAAAPQDPLSATGRPASYSGANQPGQKIVGYVLNGKEHRLKSANITLKAVLDDLQARDSGLLERFKRETDTEKRHLVDPERKKLYITAPWLIKHSRQLQNGWWLIQDKGVDVDRIIRHIKIACRLANIEYGSQLNILWE